MTGRGKLRYSIGMGERLCLIANSHSGEHPLLPGSSWYCLMTWIPSSLEPSTLPLQSKTLRSAASLCPLTGARLRKKSYSMGEPPAVIIGKVFCPACRALTYHVRLPGSPWHCLACAGQVKQDYAECCGCPYDEYCTCDPQKPNYCPSVEYHREIGF